MQCETCNATFDPNPYDPQEDITGQCPNCGTPYRQQPNPLRSEMGYNLDAMPDSHQDDMAGNPLQEGTLGFGDGGWKGRSNRDEFLGSIHRASDDTEEVRQWIENDEGLYNAVRDYVSQHPYPNSLGLGKLVQEYLGDNKYVNVDWNSIDWDELYENVEEELRYDDEYEAEQKRNPPPTVEQQFGHLPPDQNPLHWQEGDIIEDWGGARAQVTGPMPPLSNYLPLQHIAPGEKHDRKDFSLHPSALVNTYKYRRVGNEPVSMFVPQEWNRDPLEQLYDQPSGLQQNDPRNARVAFEDNDFSLGGQLPVENDNFDIAVPTHTFLVTPGGQIHGLPESSSEPQPHENIARTLGNMDEILQNSTLGRLYSNGTTSWHGNGANHAPETLSQLLSDHFGRKVTVAPQDLGQTSYDPLARLSADFEAEDMDVVPPGGHTVEAQPNEAGLHSGIITPLKSINGLTVNGRPLDDQYARELAQWDQGPLMLSHDDPNLAEVARGVIESGGSGPLVEHAMNTQAGHRGQLSLPNGLTDNVHQALGNLGAWIANPMEGDELRPWKNNAYRQVIRDYHDRNRPQMVNVGVRDPGMLKVIQDVAHSDDLQPLYNHHGIPRQASGDIGDPEYQPSQVPQQQQGGGGGGNLLGSAAGGLMGRALGGGLGGLVGGGGAAAGGAAAGGGAAAAGGAAGLAELAPLALLAHGTSAHDALFHRADKIEHPNSQDSVGITDDDPEKVDQHEVNDGDNTPGQDFKMDDQTGGADNPFGENSEGLKALEAALPIVIQFAMSDEPGDQHPLIKAIHQMLEGEVPGYLDHANDEAADKVIEQHGKKHTAYFGPGAGVPNPGTPNVGVPNPGSVPNPTQQYTTPIPQGGNHGKCPICGSTYDPAHPTCPQCGAGTIAMPGMQNVEKDINGVQVGASTKTAAPMEHSFMYEPSLTDIQPGESLQDYHHHPKSKPTYGSCPGCGGVTDLSQEFCRGCLQDLPARTAADHQGPHTPEQQQAVSEMLLEQGRQDEIPTMLDPTQAWQYAAELAEIQGRESPPDGPMQDPAPPPGEQPPPNMMPVPPMTAPPLGMQSALDRYAADNVAPVCPKCTGHTTGLVTDDGTCRCHTCGHVWKSDAKAMTSPDSKASRWQVTALDHHQQDLDINPMDTPAADVEKPYDPQMDQDPSHSWQDVNGQPLQVGQQYKIHSQKYSIPDVVQIQAVKPSSIEITETGAYGLGYSREVSFEESQLDGLEFEPIGDFSDSDPHQEAPEAPDLEIEPGDESDLSQQHDHGYHSHVALVNQPPWSDPAPESDVPLYLRQMEPGPARAAIIDQYRQEREQQAPRTASPESINLEPNWDGMRRWILNMARTDLENALKVNAEMASEAVPEEELYQAAGTTFPMEQNYNLPSADHPLGPQTGKTAGAKFTPMQQREFIDEQGVARNADLLDLRNTHYESPFEEDDLASHFLW